MSREISWIAISSGLQPDLGHQWPRSSVQGFGSVCLLIQCHPCISYPTFTAWLADSTVYEEASHWRDWWHVLVVIFCERLWTSEWYCILQPARQAKEIIKKHTCMLVWQTNLYIGELIPQARGGKNLITRAYPKAFIWLGFTLLYRNCFYYVYKPQRSQAQKTPLEKNLSNKKEIHVQSFTRT